MLRVAVKHQCIVPNLFLSRSFLSPLSRLRWGESPHPCCQERPTNPAHCCHSQTAQTVASGNHKQVDSAMIRILLHWHTCSNNYYLLINILFDQANGSACDCCMHAIVATCEACLALVWLRFVHTSFTRFTICRYFSSFWLPYALMNLAEGCRDVCKL